MFFASNYKKYDYCFDLDRHIFRGAEFYPDCSVYIDNNRDLIYKEWLVTGLWLVGVSLLGLILSGLVISKMRGSKGIKDSVKQIYASCQSYRIWWVFGSWLGASLLGLAMSQKKSIKQNIKVSILTAVIALLNYILIFELVESVNLSGLPKTMKGWILK